MDNKFPRILFFVRGSMPSPEALEIAEEMGPNVAFRNAAFVPDDANPEKCDGVAGEIPEAYKKFPKAEEAIKTFKEAREKERAAKKKAREEAKKAKEDALSEADKAKKAQEEADKKAKEAKEAEAKKKVAEKKAAAEKAKAAKKAADAGATAANSWTANS